VNTLNIVGEAFVIKGRLVKATVNAAGEMLAESTARTPFRKGELRSKRRVTPLASGARLEWRAQHAAPQNAGQARGRVFRNYTTAGTGKGFAQFDPRQVVEKIMRLVK
jgi:hypothetical protein